jgi:hypothetical protein
MADSIWFSYAGSIALVVFLYGAKGLILSKATHAWVATALFSLAVAACIPMTWALSPDWNNRHVFRIAIYAGNPIATLSAPVISFFADLARRTDRPSVNGLARCLFEWLVAVPLWFAAWILIEFFVLGWIWI